MTSTRDPEGKGKGEGRVNNFTEKKEKNIVTEAYQATICGRALTPTCAHTMHLHINVVIEYCAHVHICLWSLATEWLVDLIMRVFSFFLSFSL